MSFEKYNPMRYKKNQYICVHFKLYLLRYPQTGNIGSNYLDVYFITQTLQQQEQRSDIIRPYLDTS